jgi:PAS domain S-box-containing protein
MTGNNKTILLVEDEALIALAEARMLEGHGYSVVTAHTGEEAVDAAKSNPGIDLVLMDIDLGRGMDGTQAAEIILRERDVPVVFLSSHTEPEIVAKTERITSYGYVVKNTGGVVLDASIKMAFRLFEAHVREKNLSGSLLSSEEMYRELVENANSIILRMDARGVVLFINEFAQGFFGYSPEEILGRNVVGAIVPERDMTGKDLERMILDIGENPARFSSNENENMRKDGSRVWVSWTNRGILNGRGEVTEVLCIGNDITERKRMELKLRESEQRFRLLAENSTDVIWTMSFEGRFLYVSPSMTGLCGYTPEEVMKIPFERYVLPEYAGPAIEEIARELALPPEKRRKSHFMELRQFCKDGSVIDIEVMVSFVYDDNGNPTAIQGSTRDITARKRIEDRLKEQSEFLRALIEAMPNPVFYKDADGRYLGCNRAYEDFMGLDCGEITGKTVFDLSPRDLAERYYQADRELFENPGAQVYESRVELRDGTRRDVIFHKATFFGQDGSVAGIIGAMLDITERKQAEEKILILLQESDILREKAERLNREKELILKEVHHRVKNNMSVIMSLLSLQARAMKDPAAIEALNEARNRVYSMVVLYDKLYRTENFKEVPVGEYLPLLVREIMGIFPHGGVVEVETRIDDFVLSAKKMVPLGILVNELLTNSMKYAFAGRERGVLRVSASAREGRATLVIEDNGVGIPDGVDLEHTGGFGLQLVGLLAMQLHGTIRLERGEGTRFVLEFAP